MRTSIVLVLIIGLISCQSNEENTKNLFSEIDTAYEMGNFSQAKSLILSSFDIPDLDKGDSIRLVELFEKIDRIKIDFSKNEDKILEELHIPFPNLSPKQVQNWEISGKLEMRIIDGEKSYFKYAVNNLYRLDSIAALKRDSLYGPRSDGRTSFCLEASEDVINRMDKPIDWKIQFSIEIPAGTIPEGEVIRCWMPFPKPHSRQFDIKLVDTNNDEYELASVDTDQRSIYMESISSDTKPAIFQYTASFTTKAEWQNPNNWDLKAYNQNTELFKNNTCEQAPHIVFSPKVKRLTDSLTRGIDDPVEIVRAIYYWIDGNIPWASALEYSTFDCIPDYVLDNQHGDCGMVTLLFMSMARYKGIPVKWQSGWMLHPGYKNLHDWAEVFFEGIGWVPLDMSFGLQKSSDKLNKEYYMTGIDAYRLIVNDAISGQFSPMKNHLRSEPIDFQRGEVEWNGGNLYFNQWNYSLKIIESNEQ